MDEQLPFINEIEKYGSIRVQIDGMIVGKIEEFDQNVEIFMSGQDHAQSKEAGYESKEYVVKLC